MLRNARKLIHRVLILIILGSEVSVQIEQEDPISPALTSDKDASVVLELEPGKEWIQLKKVGKNENSGKCNKKYFLAFIYMNYHIS